MTKLFATALLATLSLAADQYLKDALNNLNKKDQYYLDEDHYEYLNPDYVDDIQKGLGDYGHHNEQALRKILEDKKTKFAYDQDRSAFAGPGCYNGCNEESGSIVTIIPAKKVCTKTYTKELHEGNEDADYTRKGEEKQTWSCHGNLLKSTDS